MSEGPEPLCFTCGLPTSGHRLNHLPSGQVCPTCRDRLLDMLPAPFTRKRKSPRKAEAISEEMPPPFPPDLVRVPRRDGPRNEPA